MKLYEICKELENIIEDGTLFVDTETGEVLSAEALDALKLERDEKVDSCLMVMRQYETDSVALDSEIKRLTALKKHYENRASSLKEYVKNCLNGEEFKSDKFKIGYRTTKAVLLTDWRQVPEIYFKDQTEKDIAKSALLQDLKAGKVIPGAELEERKSMVVK